MDDPTLIERLRQGDRDAFDAIFRAHYAPLVGIAEGVLRRRDVAEEVVQDVMLELWRRREALVVRESLRAYLFQATRNRALNSIRHGKVEERGEPHVAAAVAHVPATDAPLAEAELDAAIRAAVGALPEPQRTVFELSRVHGLRYAEIAETLGISVKTVEARMGRSLKALRARLAAWLPDAGA